jgi:hypothetical protein
VCLQAENKNETNKKTSRDVFRVHIDTFRLGHVYITAVLCKARIHEGFGVHAPPPPNNFFENEVKLYTC